MSSILGFLRNLGQSALRLLGGWDNTLRLLVAMMAMDYVSGLIVAAMGRSPKTAAGFVDSRAGMRGLLRKGLILMVLAVAAQIDATVDSAFVRAATAWFYIVNEAISIVENAALAGLTLPEKLLSILGRQKAR